MGAGIANQVGPYMYADGAMAEKTFEGGRTFIVVIAGAYNAGIIGSEHNGIAILDKDHGQVVLDQHLITGSGYSGPSRDQQLEFQRIMKLDWAGFRDFMRDHPRFRPNSVPDIRMDKPIEIAPIADRLIFPAADRNPESPYKAPLQNRREIIEFIASHSFHKVDGPYSPSGLAWNIKVGGFDSTGKHEGFEPDPAFNDRWDEYVSTNDALFWQEASDAVEFYTGGNYTMYEGSPDGAFEFRTAGRSGGWLVLTKFFDRKDVAWENSKEVEAWLDELGDEELVSLYRLVDQLDTDLADPGKEMQYRYASRRQAMEEEWSNEARPAVA